MCSGDESSPPAAARTNRAETVPTRTRFDQKRRPGRLVEFKDRLLWYGKELDRGDDKSSEYGSDRKGSSERAASSSKEEDCSSLGSPRRCRCVSLAHLAFVLTPALMTRTHWLLATGEHAACASCSAAVSGKLGLEDGLEKMSDERR